MCGTALFLQLAFLFIWLCHVSNVNSLDVITQEKFRQTIDKDKYVLILFSTETCERCIDAEKEVEKVQSPELFDQDIIKVKCDDPGTAVKYGVTTVPQLVFFRGGNPVLYEIPEDTRVILKEDVEVWLDTAKDVATQSLNEDSFEHLTQASTGATTGDWLVIFDNGNSNTLKVKLTYSSQPTSSVTILPVRVISLYNSACESYLPAIEGAGVQIKHRMNVAKVNTETNPALVARFNIVDCPTTYLLGKMYLYFSDDKDRYDIKSLKLFVTSWYKNVKAQKVPGIPTAFEKLTESIAQSLKEKMNSPNRNQFLIVVAVILGIVAFIISLVVVLCAKKKDVKTE